MKCPYCDNETKLYRQIFANGTDHITERCTVCGNIPVRGRPFLPNDTVKDVKSLPIFNPHGVTIPKSAEDEQVEEQLKFFEEQRKKPQPVYHHLNLRKS